MTHLMNLAVSGACAFLLSSAAVAQEAVPLTDELFTRSWVIADFEGRSDVEFVTPPTFYIFEIKDRDVGGDTPCGDSWNAKIDIDLPSVTITEVEAFYSDECPAYRDTMAIIKALEQVTAARTSTDGLELIASDGRRLMLLNAGG